MTYGSIIVVSSTASIYGGMWGPAYTMTQHAVLGLVKSSVVQLKGTGIRINIVSNGTIDMGIELSKVRGLFTRLTGSFKTPRMDKLERDRNWQPGYKMWNM